MGNMKASAFYLLILVVMFSACKSQSAAEQPQPPAEKEPVAAEVIETGPHPISVSQEVYDNTLAEVRLFVDRLNQIIRNKDYAGWKDALSDEFFERISSPEFLEEASKSALLRSKKIVLKTPNDYFLYVVVPSRSNSRVDEIEFIASNSVKVFYVEKIERKNDNNSISTGVRRLRLYELIKKSGDTWKIID